jgi:hypothetical protein
MSRKRREACIKADVLTKLGYVLVAAIVATTQVHCDDPNDGGKLHPRDKDLVRVMYWGNVSPTQDEPNQGTPTGKIWYPQWYAADAILVHSSKLEDPGILRGLFKVDIDPATFAFRGVSSYAFPDLIRNFDVTSDAGEILVTMSEDPSSLLTVRCIITGPSLAIVDTVVAGSWLPVCARYAGPSDGIVTYALTPPGGVAGFYYRESKDAPDSLILAVDLEVIEANGFDADELVVAYGVVSSVYDTDVHIFSLATGEDTVVTTVQGEFRSISISPDHIRALVETFETSMEPGSRVYVVDLSTGSFEAIGLRTQPEGFVLAQFPSWDPTGARFAFSASGYTGEGDVFPRELWIKSRVP